MGANEIISLREACDILSISQATARNWMRSGLLISVEKSGRPVFALATINALANDIKNNKIDRLNKRRNKKYVPGNNMPRGYVESQDGQELVAKIIAGARGRNQGIGEGLKRIILAEYALKFYFYKETLTAEPYTKGDLVEEIDQTDNRTANYKKEEVNLLLLSIYKESDDFNDLKDPYNVNEQGTSGEKLIYNLVRDFLDSSGLGEGKVREILATELASETEFDRILSHEVFPLTDDVLGLLYMSLSTLSDRKGQGSYYTPTRVVRQMVDDLLAELDLNAIGDLKIVDPCCGTGNFLIELLKRGIAASSLYAYDMDEVSIFLARMNVLIFTINAMAIVSDTGDIGDKDNKDNKDNKDDISKSLDRTYKSVKKSGMSKEVYQTVLNNIQQQNSLYMKKNGKLQELRGPINYENSQDRHVSMDLCGTFDVCIGNPPWGADLNDGALDFVRENFQTYSAQGLETFTLFIELGLSLIQEGGYLSYVVPESLFSTRIHQAIRDLFASQAEMLDVIYWGNIFDGVMAPSVSFLAGKESKINFGAGTRVRDESGQVYQLGTHRQMSSQVWNFNIRDEAVQILTRMSDHEDNHFLAGQADFALGIVTGNNKVYLKGEKISDNYQPIIKGSDVEAFTIKPASNYLIYEPEKFQQVASNNLYFAPEKLIYRFISDSLVVAYDDQQILSLNSANVVRPRIAGFSMKYVLGLLNSSLLNFYFQQSFKSIKVLRSHLEALPLRDTNPEQKAEVENLVDLLIEGRQDVQTKLDELVFVIYALEDREIEWFRTYGLAKA